MDFEAKHVDDIAAAAKAMINIDSRQENFAALEMERALDARAAKQDPVSARYVVEAAEAYACDLDDRSRSGSPEWETLSKAVDVAKAPVLAEEARKREAHAMAARAASQGMGR